jgi:hypothetical protein
MKMIMTIMKIEVALHSVCLLFFWFFHSLVWGIIQLRLSLVFKNIIIGQYASQHGNIQLGERNVKKGRGIQGKCFVD